MFEAVKSGNIEEVESLLKQGANVDAKYNDGNTPLHLAIQADVDAQYNYGSTPLHLAARNGHTEVVLVLLIYGATLNEDDRNIINAKPNLRNCLKAFEEIKKMPNLGQLIEINKSRDKKKNANAISEYINTEAKKGELAEEFQSIKRKYGSDEQLSFIPECLLGFVKHMTLTFLKFHTDEKTIAAQLCESKNDIKMVRTNDIMLKNLPSEASEKIVSYLDNNTQENVLLALNKRAGMLLTKLKKIVDGSPTESLDEVAVEQRVSEHSIS